MSFLRELRKRKIFRFTGLYIVGSWVVIQVADVFFPAWGVPDAALRYLFYAAIACFPIALIFSWHYDISTQGIVRTRANSHVAKERLRLGLRDYLTLFALVLVAGSILYSTLGHVLHFAEQATAPEIVEKESPPNSIAVLPFENLSGQPEDDYLGRGLAEDILHRLAILGNLHVVSRTAAFELDTTNLDMKAIGERLGVTALLEGSVRRAGDKVRIVAQLIDTRSGYHIWSRSYDREMAELFGIYDEISAAVVHELQLTMAPDETTSLGPPTTDMQAYDYFLQARSMLQRSTRAETSANAQRFFARAVEHDPKFALAWAGQCQAYLDWHDYQPEVEKIDKATESCLKALGLDPDLVEVHSALGKLYSQTSQYRAAVAEYEAALAINPRSAEAWRGLGEALAAIGRYSEAEDAMKRAIDLDPDDLASYVALGGFYFAQGRYEDAAGIYGLLASKPSASASAFNGQGAAFYMMGEFDRAAESYRKVVEAEPSAVAYSNIGGMYFYNGQFDDACIMYRESITLSPENPVWWGNLADCLRETKDGKEEALSAYRTAADLSVALLSANPEDVEILTNLAHYHARLGDDERASEYLAQALQAAPTDVYAHYFAALVHLEAGRQQQTLDELRQAVELGYPRVLLASDPQLIGLRGIAKFEKLLIVENDEEALNDLPH